MNCRNDKDAFIWSTCTCKSIPTCNIHPNGIIIHFFTLYTLEKIITNNQYSIDILKKGFVTLFFD